MTATSNESEGFKSQRESSATEGKVDWKFLFHQLFSLEISKEYGLTDGSERAKEELESLLRRFCYYHPGSFNDALDVVLKARTSERAYEARKRFYENQTHRRDVARLDLERVVGAELRCNPRVSAFLQCIEAHRSRAIPAGENFFASQEGQNVLRAFELDASGQEQEVAFVFVPGYAAHAVKWSIFEEIVRDANLYHGRPPERPLLAEDGFDLVFEPHTDFYARGDRGGRSFDILHPMGSELGNTAGLNVESTEHLHEWLQLLPDTYANKKLIFFGYSKGAPAVLDLVRRHPEWTERVLGYVTFGGVLQGTGMARMVLEQAETLLGDLTLEQLFDQLREEDAQSLGLMLSPLFSHVDLRAWSWPKIRALCDVLEIDGRALERYLRTSTERREVRELLDGARDMAPATRARWNLLHLNDGVFRRPSFIFHLSAVTDIKALAQPASVDEQGRMEVAPLAPRVDAEGRLDWSTFSLDALFLYVSSLEGFKAAAGGLSDAQVELGNTKLPLLDRRPLADSLTEEELDGLWSDPAVEERVRRLKVTTREQFVTTPRQELTPQNDARNLHVIDLGEVKGHHWIPFVQALRPPTEQSLSHAVWPFPRKAYMRALLQVLALYTLIPPKAEQA